MKKWGIFKVQVFHEGHKTWLNLPSGFDGYLLLKVRKFQNENMPKIFSFMLWAMRRHHIFILKFPDLFNGVRQTQVEY